MKSNEVVIRISDLGDNTKFNKDEKDKQQTVFTIRNLKDNKNIVKIQII